MNAPSHRREYDRIDAFVVVTDHAGAVRYANPAALRLTGLQATDVIGSSFPGSPFFAQHAAASSRIAAAVQHALDGKPAVRDINIPDAHGSRPTFEFTFMPQRDDSGHVSGVLITGVDASCREQTATERNLQFLHRLSDATRDHANPQKIMEVVAQMLGRHLGASRTAYAEVEADNDTFTIKHDYTDGCASTVGRYSLAMFGPQAVEAMKQGETLLLCDIGKELDAGSGREMFHQIGINAIVCCPLVKYGNLVAMMAVHQEHARNWNDGEVALVKAVVERCWSTIERARAQQKLSQKERQFEELFEFGPDAMLMLDVEGNIALVNQRAEALFGYGRHELAGKPLETVVPERLRDLHGRVCESFAANIPQRIGRAGNEELQGLRRDHSEFKADVSLAPMETDAGPMVACSIRDTTEREQVQAQLQHTLRMETLGRMAGGVAHDFNNVLTIISATTELLIDSAGDDRSLRTDLATILRASEQASGLTRQLLAMSRQQVLNPEIVDLNDVIADMEPTLGRAIGDDITVKLRQSADPVTARVDREQIDQVLLSLALNSRDAMQDGGTLIVETSNVVLDEALISGHADLAAGPHALLTISDTGAGMDEATRRRMFEPFFSTKDADEGTGLGLASVYGVVKQSGGGISSFSEPGKGTTIKVFLPRATAEIATATQPVEASGFGEETVLVIEDEQEIRQVTRIMLERRGYKVLTADSGEAAIELARTDGGNIDLVLSDVVMPGMTGPEAVRQIRELRPGIPVMYMSGYAADLIAQHGIDDQPQYFVAKPFTLTELSRTVREALDDAGSATA